MRRPATVPDPPSLSAAGGDGAVSLTWKPPASDRGRAITGYRLYRGTSSGAETLLASVGQCHVVRRHHPGQRDALLLSRGCGQKRRSRRPVERGRGHTEAARPTHRGGPRRVRPVGGVARNELALTGAGGLGHGVDRSSGMTAGGAGASSATWSATAFPADQEVPSRWQRSRRPSTTPSGAGLLTRPRGFEPLTFGSLGGVGGSGASRRFGQGHSISARSAPGPRRPRRRPPDPATPPAGGAERSTPPAELRWAFRYRPQRERMRMERIRGSGTGRAWVRCSDLSHVK
jgi:hypothetical protein